jgi:hypothetical protein
LARRQVSLNLIIIDATKVLEFNRNFISTDSRQGLPLNSRHGRPDLSFCASAFAIAPCPPYHGSSAKRISPARPLAVHCTTPRCLAIIRFRRQQWHWHRHHTKPACSARIQDFNRQRARRRPRRQDQDLPDLPMESRRAHLKAPNADLHARSEQDRTHDARRPDPNQERSRPNPNIPTELP